MPEILKPLTNRNHGQNGHVYLPGGLILQWGTVAAVPSGGAANVTFPIPFPNQLLHGQATIMNTVGNSTAMSAGVGSGSNTYMPVFHNGANAPTAISWFAIGH